MKPRRDTHFPNTGENIENGSPFDKEPECKRMKPSELLEMGIGILEDYHEPPRKELKDPKPLASRNRLSPNDSAENKLFRESVEEIHNFSSPFSDDFSLFRRRKTQQPGGIDHFNKLSDEMLLMVFKWLPKKALTRCALVCRRWRRVSYDEGLWTRLDVGFKSISLANVAHVVQRGVRILRLAQADISDPLPLADVFLKDYQSKLQYLDLSMATITPEGLVQLLRHTRQLIKLSLEHTTLNQGCCDAIGKNPQLEVLNLSMCYNLDTDALKPIIKGCRRLQELNLAWTKLTTESLDFIIPRLPSSLLGINISGCRQTLADRHLVELSRACPKLTELDVSDCSSLTGACFDSFAGFQFLEHLCISRCYNVSGVSLLRTFDLDWMWLQQDTIRRNVTRRLSEMPTLTSIEVFGLLNEVGLASLRSSLSEVEVNKNLYSKMARPTVGVRRTSIWAQRVRD